MPSYPAIFDFRSAAEVALDRERFEIGRSSECAHVIQDPSVSRKQFVIVRTKGAWSAENLSQSSPTFVNDEPLNGPRVLVHGDLLRCGETRLRFLERADRALVQAPDVVKRPAESFPPTVAVPALPPIPVHEPSENRTMLGDVRGMMKAVGFIGEIPIGDGVTIGRDETTDIPLVHPSVSRRHAEVKRDATGYAIRDLGSANGTYVDGERISRTVPLIAGSRIEIGPFRLEFTGKSFRSHSMDGNVRVTARDVCVERTDANGQTKKIVNGVSLVIEPKNFVCILGPSGSGKTTLMNALSARSPATSGKVAINGIDLYASFESLKQNIALVPQKNIIHEVLTVEDALRFTAELRLPKDTSAADVDDAVKAAIGASGLEPHAKKFIKDLSGGQQRRACLANEIICKPNLLFLDEVTSGLDEQSDRDMMALFRSMADRGMTVVCVTHSLAHVEEFCHQVIILAAGGTLAFMGSPAEALDFFGVTKLGDIYLKIAEKPGPEWQRLFREREAGSRLDTSLKSQREETTNFVPPKKKPFTRILNEARRQLPVLIRRDTALALADKKNLKTAFGQALVVGLLLAILFGLRVRHAPPLEIPALPNIQQLDERALQDPQNLMILKEFENRFLKQLEIYGGDAKLLFLLAVVAIWLGCNNAAKEIVKDETIYRRERDAGLSLEGYLLSKSVVLHVLGAGQIGLLWLMGVFANLPDDSTKLGVLTHMLFAMSIGTNLGLFLSAIAQSRDQAATLVPIALIPQIVLSGSVIPLNALTSILAKVFVSSHWVYCALTSAFDADKRRLVKMGDQPGLFLSLIFESAHVVIFFIMAGAALVMKEAATTAVYGAALREYGARLVSRKKAA